MTEREEDSSSIFSVDLSQDNFNQLLDDIDTSENCTVLHDNKIDYSTCQYSNEDYKNFQDLLE